jgi:hypothetical protein
LVDENDPGIKKEQKQIVDNFDRLRKTILQHKESNRNLGARNGSYHELKESTHTHSKMYNVGSMSMRKDTSDSASKDLSNKMKHEISASNLISMPLTERGRHDERPRGSSKDRKSSHRKKSKDVCHCVRHPQKRIKFFCETDLTYMWSACKKDHKGPQHNVMSFKVDMKRMKHEVLDMLKDYHNVVNQLLNVKQSVNEKLHESDSKLTIEIDKISSHFNRVIDSLNRKKITMVDEMKSTMVYRTQQMDDKFSLVCNQIELIKDGWNSLNNFNDKISKLSYEEFSQIKVQNEARLRQSKVIVESSMKVWNQREPWFRENMSLGDDIGTILFPDFDQEVVEDEFRIIRKSVKNLHKQNQSEEDLKINKSWINYSKLSLNREEYHQINCNDKTSASTHMTSEYGIHQSEKHQRGKFLYKNLPFQGKQGKILNHDYSVLNPWYSDSSSMNIGSLAVNKNNSAIVILSNDNDDRMPMDRRDWLNTCRNNFQTEKVRFIFLII